MSADGWVDDADYPDGRRLPMTPAETAEVDADLIATAAAELEALESPDQIVQDAARALAEAARLLRLGID
jgi:hypothetical protein